MDFYVNTLLDAVNATLAAVGEDAIASLEESNTDKDLALNTIARVNRQVQVNMGKGWWFNREPNHSFTPSDTGTVNLPNNVLSESFTLDSNRYVTGARTYRLTSRGGKLYDSYNHTYDMREMVNEDGKVAIKVMILALEFDHLPQTAKDAIVERSRQQFALDFETDFNRSDRLDKDAKLAMFRLQAEDNTQRKHNRINDNGAIRNFISKVGGYNNPV